MQGTRQKKFCADHKPADYVYNNSNRCMQEGCIKQPSYAEKGTKNALFCTEHKREGYVDVRSSKCAQEDMKMA